MLFSFLSTFGHSDLDILKPKKNFIFEDRMEEREKMKSVETLQSWECKIDVLERQLGEPRSELFYFSRVDGDGDAGAGAVQPSILPVLAGN